MSSTTDRPPRTGWRTERSPAFLLAAGGGALAAILIALAAALVLPGLGAGHGQSLPAAGGQARKSPGVTSRATSSRPAKSEAGTLAGASRPSRASTATGTSAAATGTSTAAYGPRDPEESRSFPVPASVPHRSAGTPSEAAKLMPAAGAASNSQVEKELDEVEQAEHEGSHQALTIVPGGDSVGGNGTIPIPTNVPETVQRVIAGGNAIADFPYRYGGGHGSFVDDAYDCSGSVSYALAAAGLASRPMVSGELAHWGAPGPGRWITIYANAGHTFMDVDGIWFDTAGRSGPYDSRWLLGQPSLSGYAVRHPVGL